ncbi:DUF397 domain-containing protein [Streptomyces spiramenti]|uniref:DUF397 domain-containing protein n=1 Tax=Streptomyces spiramenti TaxID=2720606 RepID=A0ABX1AGV5_9ACTN|nr:DUF397 domain-containing protein [Streptomyces spiramenti]
MTTTADVTRWVTSSYSNTDGSCVEWAPGIASNTGAVPVRDSKHLAFTSPQPTLPATPRNPGCYEDR